MLDDRGKTTYARGLAAAIRVIGPTPRADALGMLQALRLSEEEAAEVFAHAVEQGMLDATDAEVCVRPTPREKRVTPRRMPAVRDAESYTALVEEAQLAERVRRAVEEGRRAHARASRLVDVLRYKCIKAPVLLDPPANDERPQSNDRGRGRGRGSGEENG